MTVNNVRSFIQKVHAFEAESHQILSKQESSKSRIVLLDQSRSRLQGLSLYQDELFRQGLDCVEKGIFRAAHVMAWAGFMDFLENKLSSDGLVKVKSVRTGWTQYRTIEEIRENIPELQIIEVAHEIGLISKTEMKTIKGLLSKRNECAHPSTYKPQLNESIGYIAELLNRIEQLITKQV